MARCKPQPENPILGTWKITVIEDMDDDDMDDEERQALAASFILFQHEDDCDPGSGRIRFLDMEAEIDWRARVMPSKTNVEFTWEGKDDDRVAHGRGKAVLGKDGRLRGEFFWYMGDTRAFEACR